MSNKKDNLSPNMNSLTFLLFYFKESSTIYVICYYHYLCPEKLFPKGLHVIELLIQSGNDIFRQG